MVDNSKYNTAKDWRGARVDEWGGLENRCGLLGHRGFESHPLRWLYPPGDGSHLFSPASVRAAIDLPIIKGVGSCVITLPEIPKLQLGDFTLGL